MRFKIGYNSGSDAPFLLQLCGNNTYSQKLGLPACNTAWFIEKCLIFLSATEKFRAELKTDHSAPTPHPAKHPPFGSTGQHELWFQLSVLWSRGWWDGVLMRWWRHTTGGAVGDFQLLGDTEMLRSYCTRKSKYKHTFPTNSYYRNV